MKIVVLDGEIANPGDLSWGPLEALGALTVWDDTTPEQVVPRIGGAEAVVTNKVPITRKTLEACPGIRYIGLLSTGYNQIDVEAAREKGIPVCNVPGYSTQAVAQHTLALLLELCNHVGTLNAAVHEGRWGDSKRWSFWQTPLVELCGKTFGAIGFGRIGQAVGRVAAAMGMRVLATGSRPTPEGRAVAEYVALDELLGQSDVVSLHCPLLPDTRELINAQSLGKMKQNAILLNTARGGLVAEQELADALNSGRLRGAGLDVSAHEPIRAGSPLLSARNCIITPHVAWVAYETRERLLGVVTQNLHAFLAGRPGNVVNP